eukprot:g3052.t1
MDWTCINCTVENGLYRDTCMNCDLPPVNEGGERGEETLSVEEASTALARNVKVSVSAAELSASSTTTSPNKTLYAFDKRMLLHEHPMSQFNPHCHPERPNRIRAIYGNLLRVGLLKRCHRMSAREVRASELKGVHDPNLHKSVSEIDGPLSIGGDTYANQHTPLAARLAAGTTAEMALRVARFEAHNGIAIVRPPGHHAERSKCMGFCLYNNVAVAAQAVLSETDVERVLIVDWDVHHGNGVQDIFEEDDRVLYVSLHRFGNGFYPGTGAANEVGRGKGVGKNLNVAWSKGMMGNAEYLMAFDSLVMPMAREFRPQLVLVAAGFDAARGDPLGGCDVTPVGYAHMTAMLQTLASGRIVVALEGGYNLQIIAASAQAVVRTLLGDPIPPFTDRHSSVAKMSAVRDVRLAATYHVQFWRSLRVLFPESQLTLTKSDDDAKIREAGGKREGEWEDCDDETWEKVQKLLEKMQNVKRGKRELRRAVKRRLRWRGRVSRRPWSWKFRKGLLGGN